MTRVFIQVFCLVALCSISWAQMLPRFEKRTHLNPKLETQLAEIVLAKNRSAATKLATSYSIPIVDGFLKVIIQPTPDTTIGELITLVEPLRSVQVVRWSNQLIMARATPEGLGQLARIDEILFIRRPIRPVHDAFFASEGLSLIGTASISTSPSAGADVDVAIIDIGFELLTDAQILEELPWGKRVDMTGDGLEKKSLHGTACAEIVHDIVPGANLHYIRVANVLDFQNAVQYVQDSGIEVVSHSLSWPGQGAGDGKGPAALAVNEAAANGVFWVNSAGNHANKIWRGDFESPDGYEHHNFAPGKDFLEIHEAEVGDVIKLYLTWSSWPTTDDDYDMTLWRIESGTPTSVAVADAANILKLLPPFESISYTVPVEGSYVVSVWKSPLAQPLGIQIRSLHHPLGDGLPRDKTIATPADAEGAFAVGAMNHRKWESGPVEDFSSRGPTTDGRLKPELVAPDGVTTFSYYPDEYFGTSAACPHVSGAAALLIASDPYYKTPERLRLALLRATIDMGAIGPDNTFGYGRLDLPTLVNRATPEILVSPLALDFGETISSRVLSFDVQNSGTAPLEVQSITASVGDFTILPSTFTLAPSGIREISATFEPSGDGPVTGTATISSNADRFPVVSIALRGNGRVSQPVRPAILVLDGERSFGQVAVGDTHSRLVPISNVGSGQLQTKASISGTRVLSVEPTELEIVPGETKSYTVIFAPVSEGDSRADLVLTSNDSRLQTISIPLSGTGVQITTAFAVAFDLDERSGNQGVTTSSTSGGAASIQVFTEGFEASAGVTLGILLAPGVVFSSFEPGESLPSAEVLTRSIGGNTLEVSIGSLGGRASDQPHIGTLSVVVNDEMGPVDLELGRVSVRRNGIFERYSDLNQIVSFGSSEKSPDFDGDGSVNFQDFIAFASVFGSRAGEDGFDQRYDLDSDGLVGFTDFLTFAASFGT